MDKENFEKSSVNFALKLYKLLLSDSKPNIVFSPFLLHLALTKLNICCAGKTSLEISTLLDYSPDQSKRDPARNYRNLLSTLSTDRQIKFCERILIKEEYCLKKTCVQIVNKYFGNEFGLMVINFTKQEQAARKINVMIEGAMQHTIQAAVKNDTFATGCSMVMIQTMCIDVQWSKGFNRSETKLVPFRINEKESVLVEMMHERNVFNYANLQSFKASVIELELHKSALTLLIILPNAKEGIKTLHNKIFNKPCEFISKITSKLASRGVYVGFPKFELDIEYMNFHKHLKKMGVETLFNKKGNFSDGFTEVESSVCVSKILHKSVIKFTEKGKNVPANPMLFGDDTPKFIVDRPFMYVLKVKDSDVIVSMGSVQKMETVKLKQSATLPRMGQMMPPQAPYMPMQHGMPMPSPLMTRHQMLMSPPMGHLMGQMPRYGSYQSLNM